MNWVVSSPWADARLCFSLGGRALVMLYRGSPRQRPELERAFSDIYSPRRINATCAKQVTWAASSQELTAGIMSLLFISLTNSPTSWSSRPNENVTIPDEISGKALRREKNELQEGRPPTWRVQWQGESKRSSSRCRSTPTAGARVHLQQRPSFLNNQTLRRRRTNGKAGCRGPQCGRAILVRRTDLVPRSEQCSLTVHLDEAPDVPSIRVITPILRGMPVSFIYPQGRSAA